MSHPAGKPSRLLVEGMLEAMLGSKAIAEELMLTSLKPAGLQMVRSGPDTFTFNIVNKYEEVLMELSVVAIQQGCRVTIFDFDRAFTIVVKT